MLCQHRISTWKVATIVYVNVGPSERHELDNVDRDHEGSILSTQFYSPTTPQLL